MSWVSTYLSHAWFLVCNVHQWCYVTLRLCLCLSPFLFVHYLSPTWEAAMMGTRQENKSVADSASGWRWRLVWGWGGREECLWLTLLLECYWARLTLSRRRHIFLFPWLTHTHTAVGTAAESVSWPLILNPPCSSTHPHQNWPEGWPASKFTYPLPKSSWSARGLATRLTPDQAGSPVLLGVWCRGQETPGTGKQKTENSRQSSSFLSNSMVCATSLISLCSLFMFCMLRH